MLFNSAIKSLYSPFFLKMTQCKFANYLENLCSSLFWFQSKASTLIPILYNYSLESEVSLLADDRLFKLYERGELGILVLGINLAFILISREESTRFGVLLATTIFYFYLCESSWLNLSRQFLSTMTYFWFSIKNDKSDIAR